MKRQIGTSASAESRLDWAARVVRSWAETGPVRIVAPTQGAADDFLRERVLGPHDGRGGIIRGTPIDAAREFATPRLIREGRVPVTGIAAEALLARAVDTLENGTDGSPEASAPRSYFGALARTVGFRRALTRTIRELRGELIETDDLSRVEPSGPDLARLLGAYVGELDTEQLVDSADIFLAAAGELEEDRTSPPPFRAVLLDVRGESSAEKRFLRAMFRTADRAVAVLDSTAGTWLDEPGGTPGHVVKVINDISLSKTLVKIRQFIFKTERPTPEASDSGLDFFSATDEGREAVEVARRIHEEARRGTPFDRMAILLRDPETYQPLLADALSRAGVAAHFTRGTMRPNPSGRAFLALLRTAAEDLSAARFAEYLSLGEIPSVRSGDASSAANDTSAPETPAVPAQWEKILVESAVLGGRDRWARRLDGLVAETRRQIRETDSEDEDRREQHERRLGRILALRDFALPLIGRLAELPAEATWSRWLELLRSLAASCLFRPEAVLEVLGELEPLGRLGPVGLAEVQRVLDDRLSFLRTDAGRRYGRVFVGDIGEAGGRTFDVVFIPGLAEGRFPRKSREDPLLLDRARAALERGRLAAQTDRTADERRLFRLAIGTASRRLVVSYPRMGIGGGKGQVPSVYALDLLRAAEGRIPGLGELDQKATAAGQSRLGWPAPIAPAEAVDDAEYDLATIGDIMHAGSNRRTTTHPPSRYSNAGKAHYLVTVHPGLARSLRTRARRWRNFWSGADGIYDPDPETRTLLVRERPGARTYSSTALERFAACPYRFFLSSMLGLGPRDEITTFEQMDPLTRGSLFHTVQFRLLTALRDEGQFPIGPANLAGVREVADRVLDRTAAEYHEELAPPIERVWKSDIEDIRTDLHGWLRIVGSDERPGHWTPRYFEYTFGMEPRGEADPASTIGEATILDGVRLRGAIDLIESHDTTGLLRIVDHKTGRAPSSPPEATGGGRVLQPLLYALAAESLLGQPVATAALFFATQRGNFRRIEVPVDDRTREATRTAIRLIDESVRDGFLPAAPASGACEVCDHRPVCGPYEETRTRRKHSKSEDPADWHDRLKQLRRLP